MDKVQGQSVVLGHLQTLPTYWWFKCRPTMSLSVPCGEDQVVTQRPLEQALVELGCQHERDIVYFTCFIPWGLWIPVLFLLTEYGLMNTRNHY